mgnify:CR=1 FL=1
MIPSLKSTDSISLFKCPICPEPSWWNRDEGKDGKKQVMSIIGSKDVYEIIRKTLGIINGKIMNHGEITGYILYKMLEYEQIHTEQELVDYTMLGILHDINLISRYLLK